GRGKHVFEVGHLEIAAPDGSSDKERDIGSRHPSNQRLGDRQRAILPVVYTEHDLHGRIVLLDQRAKAFIELGFRAVQRFQQRSGGLFSCLRQGAPGEVYGGNRRANEICPSWYEDQNDQQNRTHESRQIPFQQYLQLGLWSTFVEWLPIQ